ncbi:MAG: hypothetical protein ABI651_09415 [Verrucomicrobiota bacterium]
MNHLPNLLRCSCVWLVLLSASFKGSAALSPVSARSDLNATDRLDWNTVGVEYTLLPNPFTGQTTPGQIGVTLSAPSGVSFERVNEGSGWVGNFSPGEPLLWTFDYSGPVTFRFNQPLQAIGLDLQPATLSPFVATAEAFGSDSSSLGTLAISGTASSSSFLGLRSDSGEISSLVISLTLPDGGYDAFAFNGPAIAAIPEPGTMSLFTLAIAMAALTRVLPRAGRKSN